MSAVRMFATGLGLLSTLVVGTLAGFALTIKLTGKERAIFQRLGLSEDERRQLSDLAARPPEAAVLTQQNAGEPFERTLERIALRLNEATVRELVEQLAAREAALEERTRHLENREIELRLAHGDLLRLQRQLEAARQDLRRQAEEVESRRGEWAAAQAAEARTLQQFTAVEKARTADLAGTYAAMKAPWEQLKSLPIEDVARLLAVMEPKKAAKILDTALADDEGGVIGVRLHQALMNLDVDAASGDQVVRLARLYAFMPPEQVLPFLAGSQPEEIARILLQMEAKKRAGILESLRGADEGRAAAVDTALQRLAKAAPSAGGAS